MLICSGAEFYFHFLDVVNDAKFGHVLTSFDVKYGGFVKVASASWKIQDVCHSLLEFCDNQVKEKFKTGEVEKFLDLSLKSIGKSSSVQKIKCRVKNHISPCDHISPPIFNFLQFLYLIAGEIVPRRNRTQEKSYPNWMGTISPEISYPENEILTRYFL